MSCGGLSPAKPAAERTSTARGDAAARRDAALGSVVARMAQRLSSQGYTEPDAFNETKIVIDLSRQ